MNAVNAERIAVLHTAGGVLYQSIIEYGFDQYKQEESSALDARNGAGNWVILPAADLPADFSVETYTIVDGQLVPAPAELIAEREAVKAKADAVVEIKELQAYLTSTDYAAIKCGELGVSMADTYPDLHAGRTAARARIGALQEGGAE